MQIERRKNSGSSGRPADDVASLAPVLVQAIDAGDAEMFRFISEQEDLAIINRTLDDFDREDLYRKFLATLVRQLKASPRDTTNTLRWIDVFLKKKMGHFRRHPEDLEDLKAARELLMVKERLFANLLQVKGKLAFLIESRRASQNPDRLLTSTFGLPRIFIDERKEQPAMDGQPTNGGAGHPPTEEEAEDYDELEDGGEGEDIEDEGDLDAQEEDLMYEEELEREEGDDEEVDEKEVEELGMELEEEVRAEDKKGHYLKLKNESKKQKNKR